MSLLPNWITYPATYRSREMEVLAGWIQDGQSGIVIGPPGIGKSNLLGFLCHRPDALQLYLPRQRPLHWCVLVDLNNLPVYDVTTLHHLILRSFFEMSEQCPASLRPVLDRCYQESRIHNSPFMSQSSVRELLAACRSEQIQVVLVLDRFDQFYQQATPEMADTLRGLRDSFKEQLGFIVGIRRDIGYQQAEQTALGELYELLDAHVCQVRPLNTPDAYELIIKYTRNRNLMIDKDVMDNLVRLTGGYPALLKTATLWWAGNTGVSLAEWQTALFALRPMQVRLQELWNSLSQEERQTLWDVCQSPTLTPKERQEAHSRHSQPINQLVETGLVVECGQSWSIFSDLFQAFVAATAVHSLDRIWWDKKTDNLYQGQSLLKNLSPLEDLLLRFLLRYPSTRHSYTELIAAVWPAAANVEGVSTEALFQVVKGLRRKIEPDPTHPRYILNWRGLPEGGYQCFPEGRPGEKQ